MPGNRLKGQGWWPLLWAALVGIALFAKPPLPVDETRYLSVAWEMWQGNQFLVPHSNGLPYSHKPPLLFWFIHFGWWLFGVNAWSARLTAPLFALGSMLFTRRLAKILWPEDKEIAGAVPWLLLGMPVWSMFTTLTMFDMPEVFFSLAAYLGLLRASQGSGAAPWLLVGFGTGLGLLVKGPVVLLYIVPPALLAPWWGREGIASWRLWYGRLSLALTGGIMLALCWAIPAARSGGPEYGHAILLGQTAGRLLRSFAHDRPFFWYALWLPLLCFPWVFWRPVWRSIKQLPLDQASRFCLSAIIPSFVLLSCISGKQIHYLLPLLPAAALLMARAVSGRDVSVATTRWPLAGMFILFGLILLAVPRLHLQGGDSEMLAFLPPWLGWIPLLAGVICLLPGSLGSAARRLRGVTGMNVLVLALLHLALARPLHLLYDLTDIGAALRNAEEAGHAVAAFPARLTDQVQFAGRLTRPLLAVATFEKVVLWAQRNPDQFCLFFTSEEGRGWLQGKGTAARFKEGWLVLRPAAGLYADYQRWKTAPAAGNPPTSPPG